MHTLLAELKPFSGTMFFSKLRFPNMSISRLQLSQPQIISPSSRLRTIRDTPLGSGIEVGKSWDWCTYSGYRRGWEWCIRDYDGRKKDMDPFFKSLNKFLTYVVFVFCN